MNNIGIYTDHPSDVDGEGLIASTVLQSVQEFYLASLSVHEVAHVVDAHIAVEEELLDEDVIVGGEQPQTLRTFTEVFEGSFSDGHSIESRGTSAQFINDNKAVWGGVVQHRLRLLHLNIECRFLFDKAIACADASEYPIEDDGVVLLARDKDANLSHNSEYADHSQ